MPIGQHKQTALLGVENSEMRRPCAASGGREKGLEYTTSCLTLDFVRAQVINMLTTIAFGNEHLPEA